MLTRKKAFSIFLSILFVSLITKAQTDISGIVNSYYKATAIVSGTISGSSYSGITLQSIAGLAKGDRVLIIQMKGASIVQTNNASFGNISAIGNAGKYEFSSICSFFNNTIVLNNQLQNTYDASLLQVVRIPVYTSARVIATLQAQNWNPVTGTGGVIAIEVNGTLTLNADINANGAGLRGGALIKFTNCSGLFNSTAYSYSLTATQSSFSTGAYKGEGINSTNATFEGGRGKQSNGGGGGNNHNTGGGGGSNFGGGGRGGTQSGSSCNGSNFGIGGSALNTFGYSVLNNRIFLGGGGGSGHSNGMSNPPVLDGTPGGNGGGIIYIKCNSLIGNSRVISANGAEGINPGLSPSNRSTGDGGGGGGAGGSVLLNISSYSGSVTIESRGANGNSVGFQAQCPGPGGGGGGGIIWYNGSITATTNVTGGATGLITSTGPCNNTSNGGIAGNNGILSSGFVTPQGSTSFNCALLPLNSLTFFNGRKKAEAIEINWGLTETEKIEMVTLQRRKSGETFQSIYTQSNPVKEFGIYTDVSNELPINYRLLITDRTGTNHYSNELFFGRTKLQRLIIYPNPAKDEIKINLPSFVTGTVSIAVFNVTGTIVLKKEIVSSNSQQPYTLSIAGLQQGVFILKFFYKDEMYLAKLIKQ